MLSGSEQRYSVCYWVGTRVAAWTVRGPGKPSSVHARRDATRAEAWGRTALGLRSRRIPGPPRRAAPSDDAANLASDVPLVVALGIDIDGGLGLGPLVSGGPGYQTRIVLIKKIYM